ncbi:hypothetical protein [Pseudomonas viridiflava]|uniref:hypothetical protein n=1 Tax=Pseudomonas viridiflava TaxID=33069 RepID=UPI0004044949|nr:hypothetical protein [Pseudomonas viridiflava]
MAKYEIRLSTENIETRGSVKIAIRFYEEDELLDKALITLVTREDYKIKGSLGQDEQALIDLATAFERKILELTDG